MRATSRPSPPSSPPTRRCAEYNHRRRPRHHPPRLRLGARLLVSLDATNAGDYGRSILTDVVPLQDALNKSLADMVVAGEDYPEPLWALLKYRSEDRNKLANPFIPIPPLPLPPGVPPAAGPETVSVVSGPAGQPRSSTAAAQLMAFVTLVEGPPDPARPARP